MEFVDGRSLDQVVVTQGTFSAREAALVGWEFCRAVAALHREGLAHGLLSPDNIVREAGGRLVLMDVWPRGVPIEALDLEAVRCRSSRRRCCQAIPPTGAATSGLGVVLFDLVSGAYPVRASSLADLAGRYERGERTPLADFRPDLPDDFIRIVERACDPEPERRYSTIAAVKEALSRTLDGIPGRASSRWSPQGSPTRRPGRRRRRAWRRRSRPRRPRPPNAVRH